MISLFKVFMSPDASSNLEKVLQSGFITQGKMVEEFENHLKRYFDYPYLVTVNSATSGLTLAIRLMDLPPGSEILSCPLTCTATNWPILANSHKIKWVDIDENTANINLVDLEKKISQKTRAIVFVHWGGTPVDIDRVRDIVSTAEKKYGHTISVIEDCAHAFGSKYKGKRVGTHGNFCVFSLQAIKHLTTGDGGLLFLPNESLYKRAKLLRWYGIDREQRSKGDFRLEADIPEWGYKFHMNDINASIGVSNLPYMEENLSIIRDNALFYQENLSGLRKVKLMKYDPNSAYWIYTLRVKNKNGFIHFAKNREIMASQVHKRNDTHSCVAEFKSALPLLDRYEKEIVCLPVGWWVTDQDRQRIVKMVRDWDSQVIHTFGDSHSMAGWKSIDLPDTKIITHHIGPKLMYSFGRDKLQCLDVHESSFGLGKYDIACFCFGEIDARCHVNKHVDENNSSEKIINNIVGMYQDAIEVQNLPSECVWVYSVPPPSKIHGSEHPDFPRRGSDEDRRVYTVQFNNCLRQMCKRFGYTFIDVYDYYADKDGFINPKYSDGDIHIKSPDFLRSVIDKALHL